MIRKTEWYAVASIAAGLVGLLYLMCNAMISENKMRSLLIITAMLLSSTALAFGPQSSNKNGYGGSISLKSLTGFKIGKYQRPDTGIRAAMISESR